MTIIIVGGAMKVVQTSSLVVLAVAASLSAGCATVSRGMGQITANKFAEPRSGTVWVVPPPQLEPVSGPRTVYISWRNISDAQNLNFLNTMRTAAQQQGWQVVNDPDTAKFRLRASLRYFGEVEPESGGANVANGLGAISGAAVGIGAGMAVARASNSNLGGVAAGGMIGGLVAAGIANASRPREYAAIIDFVLEEYNAKPIQFTVATDSASGTRDGASTGNARMASGGGTSMGNTSGATMTRTSHYFPHGVRLSAWANQMAMKEEEALPLIESRIESVVTQLLPM
ncbi:complement resistance protein TraT [Sinimarinibacterium thermocellulolyticum]|uniref:Complement resistance protein TraT n=1 Tax=Sinimarinibacterium thermocellulolyticum TaxID=3170016 RepID=A0ABV2A7C6_9GAMM